MRYNEQINLKLYTYTNNAFTLQAIIDDYQEISFSHNLYEAGDFTITINYNIPNALKFERGMFIQFGNDPYMFGEILTISDSIGEDGKGSQQRTITGKDARYIFKRRVIKNLNNEENWAMTDKGEICLRELIKAQCGTGAESKRQLPVTNTIPSSASAIGKEYSVAEAFSNLYDTLVTIATQSEIGWRIKFDGALILEVFAGADLSSQVQFSTDYDSLANGEFTDSAESYANTVYVAGKGTGSDRDIYEGEQEIEGSTPTGLDRYEAFDNQSSMTSEAEYEAEALSMLTQYGQTIEVSGQGLAKCPYIFKEQYNIGDTITLAFSGKSAKAQILSVTENWTWGQYGISFSFGKPQNDLSRQLQLILKQIQKASNKTTSTSSVKYYTIPTDTTMPKADVIYDTIGFVGTVGTGATFTLYLDNEKTGAKTYHVYFKQLGGTGKLTLTTGKAGATNLTLNAGTYVAIIYVDENGNVTNTASTPTTTIEAGSTQPATSGGVSSAIGSLNIESIGTTSFKARQYSSIVNNTEYEFADIVAVSDVTNVLVSISTTSAGNVCGSTWLVSIGNSQATCGITLLNKSGYGGGNRTLLKVNYSTGGSCSLVFKLSSLGSWSGNNQSGYISILCLNGRVNLKEKTTNQTSRNFTKSLETNQSDGNQIATDTLIDGTITNARKCARLNYIASTLAIKYFKITGLIAVSQENVFMVQGRAGELLIISCGHGEGTALATPKIKRLLDVYSKIMGFTVNGSDVYMKVGAYSHEIIFSQLGGSSLASIGITETTQAQYDAGTPITIET